MTVNFLGMLEMSSLLSNRQNNFADMLAALHQIVRFRSIFQGKAGCDEGLDFSAFDQRPDVSV
jgi:hypothetical protein